MYQRLLRSRAFFEFLLRIDVNIAEAVGEQCCPHCDNEAHVNCANYRRKPRGGRARAVEKSDVRFSFCCSADGCRRRVTPPSIRFLGRRVYFSCVMMLVFVLEHGASEKRCSELGKLIGADQRTIYRWRVWWQRDFVTNDVFRGTKARHGGQLESSELPGSFVRLFSGHPCEKAMRALLLLLPLSTTSCPMQTSSSVVSEVTQNLRIALEKWGLYHLVPTATTPERSERNEEECGVLNA